MNTQLRRLDAIFSLFFFLILSLPILLKISGVRYAPFTDPATFENRVLASKPDYGAIEEVKDFTVQTEAWLNDSMPFRNLLLEQYNRLWTYQLRSTHGMYILGRDDEVYMEIPTAKMVSNYFGLDPLPEEFLLRAKYVYAGIQSYCQERGIEYLFVLIPDKPYLYKNSLPGNMAYWGAGPRYDQIQKIMSEAGVNALFLAEPLREKCKNFSVYNKIYDLAHWNGYGLECAYEEICRRLNLTDDMASPPFLIKRKSLSDNPLGKEIVPFLILKDQDSLRIDNTFIKDLNEKNYSKTQWENSDFVINLSPSRKTMAVLSDSYFRATHQTNIENSHGNISPLAHHVHRFFAAHYVFFNHQNDFEWLYQRIKPDYLIEIVVERSFNDYDRFRDPYFYQLGKVAYHGRESVCLHDLIAKSSEPKEINDIEAVQVSADGVSLLATGNDPYIQLPSLKASATGELILSCSMYSPEDTWAVIYHAQEDESFSEEKTVKEPVKKGLNKLTFVIKDQANKQLNLRFDPALLPGMYTIRKLSAIDSHSD